MIRGGFLRVVWLLFLAGKLEAGGVVSFDEGKVLTLSLSQKGINRISVEGDVIKNILLNPPHLQSDVQLDESGHLFILGNETLSEAYVSLVTENGFVQDLKLLFKNISPKPFILKVKASSLGLYDQSKKPPSNPYASIFKAFLKGDRRGWTKISPLGILRVSGEFRALPLETWISSQERYRLDIFQVEGKSGFLPSPKSFKSLRDSALVLNETHLSARTQLFVIQERKKS